VLIDFQKRKKFVKDKDLKKGSAKEFLDGFLNQSLTLFVKSSAPTAENKHPKMPLVYQLTGNTFRNVMATLTTKKKTLVVLMFDRVYGTNHDHLRRVSTLMNDMKVETLNFAFLNVDTDDPDHAFFRGNKVPETVLFGANCTKQASLEEEFTAEALLTFLSNNDIAFDLEQAKTKLSAMQSAEENDRKARLKELVDRKQCTYTLTGRSYQVQSYFRCITCKTDRLSVCASCKEVCHKGHELDSEETDLFYCDCGAGDIKDLKCKCLTV